MKPKYRVVTEIYQDGTELYYSQVKWFCFWLNLHVDASTGFKWRFADKANAHSVIREHMSKKVVDEKIEYYYE